MEVQNKLRASTIVAISTVLVLSLLLQGLTVTGIGVNASTNNSTNQDDMESIVKNINSSLAKLTGRENTSDLLNNTLASINSTASQLATDAKGMINDDSLNTAAIIAKKIGIGIADVISNISGELKQGIESK
jgi:hypothetical protein